MQLLYKLLSLLVAKHGIFVTNTASASNPNVNGFGMAAMHESRSSHWIGGTVFITTQIVLSDWRHSKSKLLVFLFL
jgi:hypothetical protein